ncbi:hypothetical protein SERLADRAFT_404810 [Serpula lacrymans var. lacrymans S7.9]|uniref:Uncharacterized protein n=1 Tax=Serpula lacrymans var. lacrymans (strain S7.9) TaxID=578457 RepID=F8NF83_SERL9|nr:uncharacterized protein SERLADRAFT_404810 [Serpula lacrymans var. lacrymans S7.9]EGO30797.1 hypothetical protein SERLADRAFT_404810 [Serpula lacrymans var. lacrymans S7.9]
MSNRYQASATFIQVVHHPQSGKHDPVIIPLDSVTPSADQGNHKAGLGSALEIKLWVPFHNYANFEYAEIVVRGLLNIEKTLQVAHAQYVQFQEGNVSACYLGETHYFKFQYRDPWKIYRNWIMDETLVPLILWNPCRKYYCRQNGRIVLKGRIYDEFNSANKWWDVQEYFPQEEPPHCFLPISLWLNKGNITKRKCIGNGGGVLVGYMPIPLDPANPSDQNTADTIKWQCFKREVYHKVAKVIFHSLRWPAHFREAMACGDKIGKWGKHISLLLTVLAENGNKGHMARNMRNVSRWPGLKHFMNVTTVKYADGQVFYDILKCILHCIVQILPRNSTLVHGIQAYARYPLMIGLICMTEGRTHRLKEYITQYEQCCEHISNNYEKDFHFSKQHTVYHMLTEIWQKGATENYDTRMACIDKNQEAITHIRMTVDNYDKAHHNNTEDQDLRDDAGSNDDQRLMQPTPGNHWMLGSPTNLTSLVVIEHCEGLKGFHKRLRSFLVSSCNVAVGDGPIIIRKYEYFKPSNGIPRTRWLGALLYDEARHFKLVMAGSLIRGAHMIEAFDLKEGRFYLSDLIDGDMFLHFGK